MNSFTYLRSIILETLERYIDSTPSFMAVLGRQRLGRISTNVQNQPQITSIP